MHDAALAATKLCRQVSVGAAVLRLDIDDITPDVTQEQITPRQDFNAAGLAHA